MADECIICGCPSSTKDHCCRIDKGKCELVPVLECNHEAKRLAHVWFFMLITWEAGTSVIHSVDTDVFILLFADSQGLVRCFLNRGRGSKNILTIHGC